MRYRAHPSQRAAPALSEASRHTSKDPAAGSDSFIPRAQGCGRLSVDHPSFTVVSTLAKATDLLLNEHGIYIQPINYQTVPRGTELLRIAPSRCHDDDPIDALAEALVDVWQRLGLPLRHRSRWAAR